MTDIFNNSRNIINSFFSDEGEYICPVTTVFGLHQEEINWLVNNQDKLNLTDKLQDRNKSHDGIEITTSCWKVNKDQLPKSVMLIIRNKINF